MKAYLPANWPIPLPTQPLIGSIVRLEHLTFEHADALAQAGSDPKVWQFITSDARTEAAMHAYVEKLLNDWNAGSTAPFAVHDLRLDRIVGCTRLKELDRNHRRALIGSWYAPEVWRTGVNLEAKWLLLRYAFDVLECVRVEFHTDARNDRSRASLDKLGAKFEGILRAHQIARDGSLRDSAIFSILASEWTNVSSIIRSCLRR
ncbi:GCN5-related N-acetyltransferase [Candidatus Koribacter versatilis Ellin345]|uniref:GCN5-related N-acetyltransferase n=1 Tax=Koribacter versatilis (strain Ellin345) TaxID=204669 RepID=Q1IRB1_KORVE|nr:GNAT family protein [Candidatus Koribacter versatilis]ABF40589.1 GCN5-related N-acetyltransferase [Candidatus Koribacter versatilis Ellin345]